MQQLKKLFIVPFNALFPKPINDIHFVPHDLMSVLKPTSREISSYFPMRGSLDVCKIYILDRKWEYGGQGTDYQ
jgi:hypothetical protein